MIRKEYVELAERLGAKVISKGKASHYLYFLKELNAKPKVTIGVYNVHMYFVLSSYFNCVRMPEEEFEIHS